MAGVPARRVCRRRRRPDRSGRARVLVRTVRSVLGFVRGRRRGRRQPDRARRHGLRPAAGDDPGVLRDHVGLHPLLRGPARDRRRSERTRGRAVVGDPDHLHGRAGRVAAGGSLADRSAVASQMLRPCRSLRGRRVRIPVRRGRRRPPQRARVRRRDRGAGDRGSGRRRRGRRADRDRDRAQGLPRDSLPHRGRRRVLRGSVPRGPHRSMAPRRDPRPDRRHGRDPRHERVSVGDRAGAARVRRARRVPDHVLHRADGHGRGQGRSRAHPARPGTCDPGPAADAAGVEGEDRSAKAGDPAHLHRQGARVVDMRQRTRGRLPADRSSR